MGLTLAEVLAYKEETGNHHPCRKKGKVNELSLGYQGWLGALKAFGAPGSDEELKSDILAWRAASPAIVELWGGQERNWQPELFGIEGAFVYAMLNPGAEAWVRGMRLQRRESATGDAMYIRLLSGRELTYHQPQLAPSSRRPGTYSISYEGNNTNPKSGPVGWIRMETWGGRLVENIVQATARDIQWHGILNLERAGYPIVLHVYDEDVAEVPEDFGSVEEFERLMSAMPEWAADWPIRANGGWRGKRYRK
jgi:DNA polymerase